jgi:adenosylmethionine-8-amino-7-oxononanoate aminotransferase
MNRMTFAAMVTAAGLAAAVGMRSVAIAEERDTPAETQVAPQGAVSETEIDNFTKAAAKVMTIRRDYEPAMEAEDEDDRRDALQEQADAEMVQAVHEEGLSVERFNAIYVTSLADPALRGRILQRLRAME